MEASHTYSSLLPLSFSPPLPPLPMTATVESASSPSIANQKAVHEEAALEESGSLLGDAENNAEASARPRTACSWCLRALPVLALMSVLLCAWLLLVWLLLSCRASEWGVPAFLLPPPRRGSLLLLLVFSLLPPPASPLPFFPLPLLLAPSSPTAAAS